MPHDSKGNKIESGDLVTFRARVKEVFQSEDACNASFEIVNPTDKPEYTPFVTCNTRLCEQQVSRIARACHEANRALCVAFGDDSLKPWEDAEQWQRDSAVNGVKFALANPDAGPECQHMAWCDDKIAAGWTFGPVKDAEKKEHPCLVPYEDLPPEQRAKDHVFRAIVRAMS